MTTITELVSPIALTLAARLVPEPIKNPLTSVLLDRPIQGIKTKTVRRVHRSTTAKYRAYDAEAPIGKRPDSIVVSELTLPPISEKLPISESLIQELAEGGGDPAILRIRDAIYDDVDRLTTAIRNRAELARGQFLSTGKVTIDENGFIAEADYLLPGTHTATAPILWSVPATAIPLDNEQTWTTVVETDAQRPVIGAICSKRIFSAMLKSEDYRNAFWAQGSNSPTLTPQRLNEVRAAHGLAPLIVYDGIVPADSGTQRVIPDNLFILVTDTVGEGQWGTTAESRELVGRKSVDFIQAQAPGLTVVQYSVPDPVATWTKVSSVFLPVAGDINGLFVATVLAA